MLDEKDLQVLRMLLQEQEERINQRMDRMFQEQRQGVMQDVKVLMDAEFKPQFDLLAKDVQAVREEMISKERIDKMFQEQRRGIMHDVKVLMDAEFKPRFDLLAEDVQIIREKMVSEERMEEAEADIQVLKASVRMLSEDVRALKKAQ